MYPVKRIIEGIHLDEEDREEDHCCRRNIKSCLLQDMGGAVRWHKGQTLEGQV